MIITIVMVEGNISLQLHNPEGADVGVKFDASMDGWFNSAAVCSIFFDCDVSICIVGGIFLWRW